MSYQMVGRDIVFNVSFSDLVWDSGYGDQDATLDAEVAYDPLTDTIKIKSIYFGWIDQDGGDHEADYDEQYDEDILEDCRRQYKESLYDK